MKTKILTLVLSGLLIALFSISIGFAADKPVKSKPLIEVAVIEDKTPADDPQSWKPEIVTGPVISYGELEKIKIASYRKKEDRVIAAYRIRENALVAIYRKYKREEHTAFQTLKKEDIAAAIHWLEGHIYGYMSSVDDGKKSEPESKAYTTFKQIVDDIDMRKVPEEKKVRDAYELAQKRADEIYVAETSKADDLYAAATRKP